MRLIGQDVLNAAARKNEPLRRWLTAWAATVENVTWTSLDDVRQSDPKTDGVKLASKTVATVFNVKGNEYRLLTWIDYKAELVEALDVFTHAEYSKDKWKRRY